MKHIYTLAIAILCAACTKPDKSVEYTATGYNASVQYVDANEVWQSTALSTTYRVDSATVDTIIAGVDTTITIADTVAIPEKWSFRFDAPHDGTARMILTQDFGNGPGASAAIAIDGVPVASGSVSKYRDQVTLHP